MSTPKIKENYKEKKHFVDKKKRRNKIFINGIGIAGEREGRGRKRGGCGIASFRVSANIFII